MSSGKCRFLVVFFYLTARLFQSLILAFALPQIEIECTLPFTANRRNCMVCFPKLKKTQNENQEGERKKISQRIVFQCLRLLHMSNCLCSAMYVLKTDCFPTEMAFVKLRYFFLTSSGDTKKSSQTFGAEENLFRRGYDHVGNSNVVVVVVCSNTHSVLPFGFINFSLNFIFFSFALLAERSSVAY